MQSLRLVRDAYTKTKRGSDASEIWTRCFSRPLSFPVAALFLSLGWSANNVTCLSLVVLTTGIVLIATGLKELALIGTLCVITWHVLDCADGNLARVKGCTKYGEYLDALGAYINYAFLFTVLGWYAYLNAGGAVFGLRPEVIILCGCLNSVFVTLSSLLYGKSRLLFGRATEGTIVIRSHDHTLYSWCFQVGRNLVFASGLVLPLAPVMIWLDLVGYLVLFFAPVSFLAFAVTLVRTVRIASAHS